MKNIIKMDKVSAEQLQSAISNNIPGIISIYDYYPNGQRKTVYTSPGFDKIVGKKIAKLINNNPNTYYSLIHKDDALKLTEASIKAYKSNKQLDFTYRLKTDNNRYVWVRARFNMKDLDNGVVRWAGIIFDVTEQKEAELKNQINAIYLHDFLENADDMIWETDINGNFVRVNKLFYTLLGYINSELIGKDSINLILKEDRKISAHYFKKALDGEPTNYEIRCLSKHNEIKHFWVKLRPIIQNNEIISIQGVARDITKRVKLDQIRSITYKIAEKANEIEDLQEFSKLVQSELSKIMNASNFYIALYNKNLDRYSFPYYSDNFDDLDPNILYPLNNSLTDLVRKSKKPILLNPENETQIYTDNNLDLMGNTSHIWMGAPIMDKNNETAIGTIAIQSYDNKREYSQQDLKTLGFVAINIGSLIIKMLSDIQQKNTNEQLSIITKILRHDLTNDFVVIKSALRLYEQTKNNTLLVEANARVTKGLNLISQMRDQEEFSEKNEKLTPYKIDDVVKKVAENYPSILFNISGNVSAFADQSIYSIFANIFGNAIKHGNATKIEIKIKADKRKCIVQIKNNGKKILASNITDIFDEGYSTKKNGTGIGLYLVKYNVELYKGAIFLDTNEDKNVSFSIILQKSIYR